MSEPKPCPLPRGSGGSGVEVVRRLFDLYASRGMEAALEGMLEDVRYEALELIPEGEFVLARARLGGRGVSSGLEVDLESIVVHTVADGKVTRIEPYRDLESARLALG